MAPLMAAPEGSSTEPRTVPELALVDCARTSAGRAMARHARAALAQFLRAKIVIVKIVRQDEQFA